MPFKSLAQAKWGNSLAGQKALRSKLNEFNKSTDYSKLPEHVVKEKTKRSIIKKLSRNRK